MRAGPTAAKRRELMDTFQAVVREANKLEPQLSDTIPPTEPPPDVLLAKPRQHRVMAWRWDGRRPDNILYDTKETAIEAARGLSFVVHYKYVVMCGREQVARGEIPVPADFERVDGQWVHVKA